MSCEQQEVIIPHQPLQHSRVSHASLEATWTGNERAGLYSHAASKGKKEESKMEWFQRTEDNGQPRGSAQDREGYLLGEESWGRPIVERFESATEHVSETPQSRRPIALPGGPGLGLSQGQALACRT